MTKIYNLPNCSKPECSEKGIFILSGKVYCGDCFNEAIKEKKEANEELILLEAAKIVEKRKHEH